MIPIENTIAGHVADIHHLMPVQGLNIVGCAGRRKRCSICSSITSIAS